MIYFEHIWFLPLAVIAAAGAYILTRKLSICIMISSVLVAASGPFIVGHDVSEMSILLIDRSQSMDSTNMDTEIQRSIESIPKGARRTFVEFGKSPVENISDIESALFYAMNQIRQNGHIYLFSDLLQTTGQMKATVYEMSKRNISLDLFVPDYARDKEVILSKATLPQYLTRNQAANIDVVIESGSSCSGQLQVTNNLKNDMRSIPIELKPGFNNFAIPADTSANQLDYELSIVSDNDIFISNNTRRIQARIYPRPSVGIIGSENEFDTVNSLISDYADCSQIAGDNISGFDHLVIADCSEQTMTDNFIRGLRQKITNGMGLLVMSGQQLLNDNVLDIKEFSDLLPAKLHHKNKQSSPDGCIVFIVDTSGSMQGTRLILAKGIVRSTFKRLSDYDKAGIVEFYGNRKWAAPIQSASNQIDLNRAINRLTAGGGTVIFPAIEEAYYGLLNIRAASRHIVVITDGGIESADYQSLLRRIREDNINISFVLTGPATHTGFLSEMSMYGGGKFFHAADRFSLPRIDIKTLSSKNTDLFRNNSDPLGSSGWDHLLTGINIADLPSDIRYIPAIRKLSANTIVQAGANPILTGWHVGLGKVVFSHSDLFSKKNTERLFQNICRYLYKRPEAPSVPPPQQIEFEIKSCKPDYELAAKIGRIVPSKPIEQIKTINLSGYCMLITLVIFLMRVIRRRLPRKIATAAVLLVICCGFALAGYPEAMKTAMQSYDQNDKRALNRFIEAYQQARSAPDKKYALAWAMLTSQRDQNFNALESFLLDNLNANTVRTLNIVYAIDGDFDSARKLCRRLETDNFLSIDEREQVNSRVANIALISRQFDTVRQYYEQQNNTIALMKVYLLQGQRDEALKIALESKPEKLTSADLFELSKALFQMGFRDLALNNSKILKSRRDEYFYKATEFIAEMLIQSGKTEQAVKQLIDSMGDYVFSEKQLFEIGILLEKAGQTEKAIEIHQAIYDRTKAMDCLMRIAALKSTIGQYDSSYQLWLDLWRQCEQPFMIYQITPYLLDAAAKTGSLVDLVITLEDEIKAGNLDSKQVDLLIDIYTSIGDSFTPIEIVKQYYGSDTLESLKKQYHICRKCRLYRQCKRILKQLIKLDSANASDYLQQMAILAVERDDPNDAIKTAEQIKATKSEFQPEFKAGLLSMLGQHKEAMLAYGQIISQNPENYELWLLWAEQAAKCSETEKEAAIQRLSALLLRETDDNQFLVIVDSLLNLQASKAVLQKAYDITLDRIKTQPDKVYMYRLAIDILSELEPAFSPANILLDASFYAPQRRLAFIREAMDSMGSLSPQRLDMARLLVFMDWQCSPAQHIKLGQLFLENNLSNLAEYLFRCNSLLNAENKNLYFTIADIYQRRSDFEGALTVMLEAFALYPDDLQTLIETASYYEMLGQFSKAYELYTKVYGLAQQQLAIDATQGKENSKNINQADRFKNIAFEGMIITADNNLPKEIKAKYELLMKADPIEPRKKIKRRSASSTDKKETKKKLDLDMIDIELEELIAANVLDSKFARRINDIIYEVSVDQAEYLYDEFDQYSLIMGQSASLQYLQACLAFKVNKKQKAKEIIKQCYLENPGSRTVEFKLKLIMESQRLYKELAEILLTSAQTNPKSSHFWREITKLYYQAGNLEKAKWANAHASGEIHFVLQVLDYLFLYSKEMNIEKMKQYFRKYQINCRGKNKYYALRWNYWDNELNDDKPTERQTAYMVLSQFPQLLDDFERYNKVVYPNRRDYHEYKLAYENIIANSSEKTKNDSSK